MGTANLNAFDLVAHFTEAALNRGLKMLPSGSTFPAHQRKDITLTSTSLATATSYQYSALLEIERPVISLSPTASQVKISCELSPSSELNYTGTAGTLPTGTLFNSIPQIPLAGTIEFVCPMIVGRPDVWSGGGPTGQSVLAELSNPATTTTITLTSPATTDVQLGTASVIGLGGTVNTAVTVTAVALTQIIQQQFAGLAARIGNLPLTTPIPLLSGTRGLQRVSSVSAASTLTPTRAVGIGLITEITPAAGGSTSVPAPPATLTGAVDGVLQASNNWLTHLVAQLISDKNPGITWTFTASPPGATFSGAVTIATSGSPFTLTSLTISVNTTSGLDVMGAGTASGACWSATISFSFTFTFGCDITTGEVMPVASPPVVNVSISTNPWCILIGVLVGFAVGTIILGIVGAIVGAIMGGVIVGGLSTGFMPSVNGLSSLAGLPVPLPVGSPALSIDVCTVDDLSLSGRVQYADLALRASQGSFVVPLGFGIDLDTGQIGPLPGPVDADLEWTGAQLQRANGATISTYFGSYNGLSLTDLESLSYGTQPIFASQIPVQMPFFPPTLLTFAARTSLGRYARCTVWRDSNMMLHISWVTYEGPTPLITLVSTATTTSSTVIDQGTDNCTQITVEYTPSVDEVLGLLGTGGSQPWTDPTPWERGTESAGGIPRASRYGAGWPGGGGPTDGPPRPPVGGGQPHGGLGDLTDILKNAPNIGGVHIGHEISSANWQVVDRAQRVTVVALATGLEVPLTYRWTVFGTDLGLGTGQLSVKGVTASFDDGWNTLILDAPQGTDIVGQVCVAIIDKDGRASTGCLHLDQPGRTRLGGCHPQGGISFLDFLGQARQFSRMTNAMAGVQERVALMAASGDARPVQATGVRDAIRLLERPIRDGNSKSRTRPKRSRKR